MNSIPVVAATRLRRLYENSTITLLERGEFVSFASCGLPYFVGNVIEKRSALVLTTPELFRERFKIDVQLGATATRIDRRQMLVEVTRRGESFSIPYDALLLATGASAIVPPLPGVERDCVFSLRSIPDSDRLKSFIASHKASRGVVVGGGFIGLEIAENLMRLGVDVTILEKADHLLPPCDSEMTTPLRRYIEEKKIRVLTGDGIARIDAQSDGGNNGVDVVTESGVRLPTDVVLLCIGVKPESSLAAQCGLTLGVRGAIVTDAFMRTSDPHIFAAGDVAQVANGVTACEANVPLAGPAQRQGRIAAASMLASVLGSSTSPSTPARGFRGAIGTAVLGFGELCVARVGETTASLQALNARRQQAISFESVYIHPSNHATYFPGAQKMSLKLTFEVPSGKILGAQCVGFGESVARRIDVIAAYINMGATVFDMAESELCYSPQFGSAKDPVNMAAMVAVNALDGLTPLANWSEVLQFTKATSPAAANDDFCLLDVRTAAEYKQDHLPNAVNIDLNELRNSHESLRKFKKIVCYCAVGQRSHNATRLLRNLGHDAYNLSGAYTTYKHFTGFASK